MPTLTWLTRDEDLKCAGTVAYRLLEADPTLSHGDPASGNMLIHGDNLDALKSLLPYYAGRVKCIYIDPPYNTRSAFEHYDDNLEHSQWLAMAWPRLELLRELLSEDGSIWINLDDNEAHYLKIIADEIFGRSNFVSNVIWEKADSPRMDARLFSSRHDHILCWAKNLPFFSVNRLIDTEAPSHYDRKDEDGRIYYLKPLRAMGAEGTREARPTLYFALEAPDGSQVFPKNPDGSDSRWRWGKERFERDAHLVEWVRGRGGWSANYRIYHDSSSGRPPESIWSFSDVGSNRISKAEIKAVLGEATLFETPKPERLIQRIIHIATNPGDLVLDSFLGSGTTAAVAHKMGRRWIGVEMGDHAVTHCAPRLVKVIDGEQGGISQSVGWQGGGGFTFHRLGEEVFDEDGRIKAGILFATLAAHVWFSETGVALTEQARPPASSQPGGESGPFLGVRGSKGYALLYNGVLGDKRPHGGNVLTNATLTHIRECGGGFDGPLIIYGEASRLSAARLKAEAVTFKQTPYDVKAR